MKMQIIYFLFSLSVFFSCNGQNLHQQKTDNVQMLKGDTVEKFGNNIMLIYQDKNNTYWFGSWTEGLYRYDGKTILHYTTKQGLAGNRIDEIKEDHAGNIYFNTNGTINQFNGQAFKKLEIAKLSESEWKLQANDLWFKNGFNSDSVYRFDGKFLYRLKIPETKTGSAFIAANPERAASPYTVYSIYNDSKANVWFGTGALGALRYNGKTFDWISEVDVAEMHNGPANGVRSIVEDKDGYFWFNSAYRYNVYSTHKKSSDRFYIRETSIGSLDEKKDGQMTEYLSSVTDHQQNIWFVTYNSGVWCYNGSKVIHYPVMEGNKQINLFSIYKDHTGNLFLGTHEHGVYKFNGKFFEKFNP